MTKSIDVNMRAAGWTESSGKTRREVPGARLIAGVSVPDSPLNTKAFGIRAKDGGCQGGSVGWRPSQCHRLKFI